MIDEIKITSLSGRGTLFMKKNEYFSYWLGNVDWGQVSGSHNTYQYNNQVGSSIVNTTIQERPLSITGWVMAIEGTSMKERCDFLNTFISPAEDYKLEYNGKQIQFRPDSSVIYSREFMSNNQKLRKFLIQATCPFPLFSDQEDTEVPFESTNKMFRFPTDFGRNTPLVFATVQTSFHKEIVNNGGFPTGLTVKIRFSGEVKNPKVWNTSTGKFVGADRTFHRGEQLEICTVSGSKHMTLFKMDGTQTDILKNRNYLSSFGMQLEPGVNVITIECEDESQRGNMEVTLYYTPLYLEVE